MRVSRAQAEENRRAVIEAAGRLFRERGFDGVGLNDLMGAAGLTQGGFYKQFRSKDDLAAQACERVMAASIENWTRILENDDADPLATIVGRYLSCEHRDDIGGSCMLTALGPDAARHSPEVVEKFEAGIRAYLAMLEQAAQASPARETPQNSAVLLSTMVGAVVLSRLVENETLSRSILDAAAGSLLGRDDNASG